MNEICYSYVLKNRYYSLLLLLLVSFLSLIFFSIKERLLLQAEVEFSNIFNESKLESEDNYNYIATRDLKSIIQKDIADNLIVTQKILNNSTFIFINYYDLNYEITQSIPLDFKQELHTLQKEETLYSIIKSSYNSVYILKKIPTAEKIIVVRKTYNIKQLLSELNKFTRIYLLIAIIIGIFIVCFQRDILIPTNKLYEISKCLLDNNKIIHWSKFYSLEFKYISKIMHLFFDQRQNEISLLEKLSIAEGSLSVNNLKMDKIIIEKTKDIKEKMCKNTAFFNDFIYEIKSSIQKIYRIAQSFHNSENRFSNKEVFEKLSNISKSLLDSMNDILEINIFSENKVTLNFSSFDIVELTSHIVLDAQLGTTFNTENRVNIVGKKAITLCADRTKIKQVIESLVENALSYSPLNSCISINITHSKLNLSETARTEAIQFSIHDKGQGILEENLHKIFQPYEKISNIPHKSGLGLSLAICKEIIEMHKGILWAENNKDGGASFHFVIPVFQEIKQVQYTPGALNVNKVTPNILVIDDEETCLSSFEMMLYGSRYNLIKIKSAQAGLKYLKENKNFISLVFLDLMMPDMYGLNFVSEVKNDVSLSSIPIILQTSSSDEEELLKALDIGVFGIVRKPFGKKILFNEIEKAILFYKLNKVV